MAKSKSLSGFQVVFSNKVEKSIDVLIKDLDQAFLRFAALYFSFKGNPKLGLVNRKKVIRIVRTVFKAAIVDMVMNGDTEAFIDVIKRSDIRLRSSNKTFSKLYQAAAAAAKAALKA